MSPAAATIAGVGRAGRLPLPALAAASLVLVTAALALVFYVAPNDANQGFSQRIFYFHVSIAFTAYACFAGGAWKALRHLWKRDPRADLESYVAIHQGLIFGALVLITGSIWAKISLGALVGLERGRARALPRPVPLLLRVLHAALLGRRRGRSARTSAPSTRSSASC